MVICLERGADLHTAQLMLLPLTVSCFSKIQIGFTFLVPAHPVSPGKRAVKRVRVCVCVCTRVRVWQVVAHKLFLGLPINTAVDMPRLHHQLVPNNMLRYEKGFDKVITTPLERSSTFTYCLAVPFACCSSVWWVCCWGPGR